MTTLTVPREKIIAILGMLGSAHEGEILNAAKKVEDIRKNCGLSWTEICSRNSQPQQKNQHLTDVLESLRKKDIALHERDQALAKRNLQICNLQQKISSLERSVKKLQEQLKNNNSQKTENPDPQPKTQPKLKPEPSAKAMLNFLLDKERYLSPSLIKFVGDLDSWFTKKGYLTQKQFLALRKVYDTQTSRIYS